MSQADFFESENTLTDTDKDRRYCRQCWREDIHFSAIDSPIAYGFLFVLSCGMIALIRPSRCCCCGTMRVF